MSDRHPEETTEMLLEKVLLQGFRLRSCVIDYLNSTITKAEFWQQINQLESQPGPRYFVQIPGRK